MAARRQLMLAKDKDGNSVHPVMHYLRIHGPDRENQTRENERRDARHPVGWCIGDIDFDEDGAVFIRNPYLANAIERQLARNAAEYENGNADFVFRLTRDQGFSGPKVNIVC